MVEVLIDGGADIEVTGGSTETPLDATKGPGTRQENVIGRLRELGARSADTPHSGEG